VDVGRLDEDQSILLMVVAVLLLLDFPDLDHVLQGLFVLLLHLVAVRN